VWAPAAIEYPAGMRKLLCVAALLAPLAFGCSKSDPTAAAEAKPAQKAEALATLTVDEVDAQMSAHQITPVDCNEDELRKKMGELPGAILVDETDSYPASVLPADKSTKLVFYCHDEG
jgi:hypothetical protein